MKKNNEKLAFTIKIIYLSMFFALCVWFILSQIFLPSERNPQDYFSETFNTGWTQVLYTGEKVPIELPGTCEVEAGETAILEKILPEALPSHMWLCFRTSKQDMEIYIGDTLRTSFSTMDTRPFGLSSASTYIFVPLEPTDSGQTLRVNICTNSSYNGVMRSVLYGDKLGIVYELFCENLNTLIPAVFMLFLGLGSLLVSLVLKYKFHSTSHLTHLGWCVVATSMWIITQTKIRQAFFPNVSVTSAFSGFLLALIPIPFAIYLNNVQNKRYHIYYVALEIATIVNFIFTAFFIVTNKKEQADLYGSTYLIFGLLILLTIITMLLDFKNKYIQSYRIIAYGICGVALASILQLIGALNKARISSGGILCYGLIILLLAASVQALTDVLRTEHSRRKALYASEAKAQFLTAMSHEIRTPINAVLGITEMIAEETAENNIREYTEEIQTAGKSLLATVNDILDYSKIEAGKMRIVPMDYDLASVINDSCSIVKSKADQKDLLLVIDCKESLPNRLHGDEVRIRQILINLLTNAIKYTNTGTVTLKVDGTKTGANELLLELTVEDTGMGIREEALPLLFKSFSRIEDSKTHHIEGSGLGLSIVHNLVTLMNGNISVKSRYGSGSTFTVTLPQQIVIDTPIGNLSKDFEQHTSETETSIFAPNARILMVDDVPMNLKVFSGLLKNTLIRVDTATSGRECLKRLRMSHYDIVFLDHMMPEMDGIETLRHIQEMADGKSQDMPIIALTANAVMGAKEEYLQYGFTDYLSKPIQKSKLLKLLKQYLPEDLILSSGEIKNTGSISNIESINFLNTKLGLSFYGGDKDFYLDIVKTFLESDCRHSMEEFFQSQDWANYQIFAHTLKSTAKSIGAEALSALAKNLENAAKEEDIKFIRANHDHAMNVYGELLDNISTLFIKAKNAQNQPEAPEIYSLLIVDDDKSSLKTAKKILEKYYRVICAGSGPEALAIIAEALPDLILMDIHMPGMSGFEVLEHLKSKRRTRNIPVVFLSADIDTETELNGLKAGAMDFIRKPFVPDIMLERINRIMESDQLQSYLQGEVATKTSEMEMLSLQAMTTLAQTIDAKDAYTKGHSIRVARYSKKLAKKLGLSAADQDTVYFMGLLHDIGKIGVPDTIINKPQKLTEEEFALVKKHPEIGYDILKNFKGIANIEQGARWHHEKMDGSGYPDGIKGDEIPYLVRLISVADSYDAMTSKRSYRDVLPIDYILQELENGKGSQFDSDVAEAMIQLIKQKAL